MITIKLEFRGENENSDLTVQTLTSGLKIQSRSEKNVGILRLRSELFL